MLFKKKNVFSLLRASIESEWKFLLHIDYMCKAHAWRRFVLFIFIIWVLLRARLNNHYEARSCKEKKKESRLENTVAPPYTQKAPPYTQIDRRSPPYTQSHIDHRSKESILLPNNSRGELCVERNCPYKHPYNI